MKPIPKIKKQETLPFWSRQQQLSVQKEYIFVLKTNDKAQALDSINRLSS